MATSDFELLCPAVDRLQEAHFFLHGMEDFYHFADPFRWHLNVFLRALKETPQLVAMALQNRRGFPDWHSEQRAILAKDALIAFLSEQRNFVVHRGMLKPESMAFIGITEGRGMKLGLGIQVDPLMDSDEAMGRYLTFARAGKDSLEILIDDDDSLPAIERRWRFKPFGDQDVVDLCATAWHRVADHLAEVLAHIGERRDTLRLNCRHDIEKIRIRAYSREELRRGIVRGFSL